MPKWNPSNLDVPTVADWVTYVANQVISQVTSGTRPTGTAGELIFETDTERFQAFEAPSTAQMFGTLGSWPTWTTTLTQSGTVTHTATYNRYYRIGTLCIALAALAVTGTGTANNIITISLPFTGVSVAWGYGRVFDASANTMGAGMTHLQSTTTMSVLDGMSPTANLRLGQTGTSMAAGLASGDSAVFGVIYEVA
jgi:hypothetical protein